MTDAPPMWYRCPRGSCGTLVAASHLATMVVRGCPKCGGHDLEPASDLHSRLGQAGVVAVKSNRKLDYRGET